MVANQPIERPGSDDYIVNKFRSLERQIAELQRQSKFPLVVAHNDPVLGRVVDLNIAPVDSDGTASVTQINDAQGNLVMGTDPDTGYGLANPFTQIPMYPKSYGVGNTSSSTAVSFQTTQSQLTNSCFQAMWRFQVSSGGVTAPTGSTYIQITDTTTSWTWSSPTATLSAGIGGSNSAIVGPYAWQIPANSIGHVFQIDIYTWVSTNPGNSNTVLASPISTFGCSFAWASGNIAGTASS